MGSRAGSGRTAASIGANIAEGGRRPDGGMCRFLQIAGGSANEAEYHFHLARDLHFLDDKDFQMLSREADELQRMLTALIERIRTVKMPRLSSRLVARSSRLSSSNLFAA